MSGSVPFPKAEMREFKAWTFDCLKEAGAPQQETGPLLCKHPDLYFVIREVPGLFQGWEYADWKDFESMAVEVMTYYRRISERTEGVLTLNADFPAPNMLAGIANIVCRRNKRSIYRDGDPGHAADTDADLVFNIINSARYKADPHNN